MTINFYLQQNTVDIFEQNHSKNVKIKFLYYLAQKHFFIALLVISF